MAAIFEKEQKVKFSHCDFAGIVFYPRFLVMLNELVEDWFEEELNYSFLSMHPDKGLPTVDLSIQFRKAARLGDILQKRLWVISLSERSVTYGFEFISDKSVILEGKAVLVNVQLDKIKGSIKPKAWDPEVKNKIKLFIKTEEK